MGCFSSGTLGFVITPDIANDNYNWQLFDITGTNPFDIFSNPSLFVACNWSSEPGETGASSDGTNLIECSGSLKPTFSKMPDIVQGRSYLLMICNQNASPAGFQVVFTGGTASITDPTVPQIKQTSLSCNASKILVKLNKKLKCETIASDGSDFSLSGGIGITNAAPGDCSVLGTDSIYLTLSQPLPQGNYTLTIKTGIDGNTLIDICGLSIADGETVPVVAGPLIPTPVDSVKPTGCSPSYIELIFKKRILCSSIMPDGSDFVINGPQTVSAVVSPTNCANTGSTSVIRLNLSTPLTVGGIYSVQAKNGSDGNTLIDECGLMTPAGSSVAFTVKPAVSADFNYSVKSSCKTDTVSFFHAGNNGVNQWNWNFSNNSTSTSQSPIKIFTDTGRYNVRLIVNNESCSDTITKLLTLQNRIYAAFTTPPAVCPGDSVFIINESTGNITNWSWNFGNGSSSNLSYPPYQVYASGGRDVTYNIRLIVTNAQTNCSDTIQKSIKALAECYVMVPSGFTPNADGLNDYLGPLNTKKAINLEFRVYDRSGQLVFKSTGDGKRWDGKIDGILQNSGIYGWLLIYTNKDTGKKVIRKGTTLLLR